MDQVWGPVVGFLGFTALIVSPFVVNKIIKFKLEIAKINADTTVRTEEIRARNQLEIEMLMAQEQHVQSQEKFKPKASYSRDETLLERPDNSKVRL